MTDTMGGHVHDGATYGGVWVGVYLAVYQRSVMGPGTCGTRCKQWMKGSGVARTFPLGEGGYKCQKIRKLWLLSKESF